MEDFETFRCDLCGGSVALLCGKDRKRQWRTGVWLAIPDDFAMPTCDSCGETYSSIWDSARLDQVQAALFSALNKDAYNTGYMNAITDMKDKYPLFAKEADEMYFATGNAQLEEALKK